LDTFLVIAGVLIATVVALLVAGRPLLTWLRKKEARQAYEQFRVQREQLEAKFFDLASRLGKPRDLRWLDCDWQSGVTFGRDVQTGMLTAFVAVNIRFEAVEGGDMEYVEAVGLLRDAAAVFHYQNGNWGTGGRALFNMNPADALNRLADQYEPVEVG
jgi:hypothetical protein